MLLPKPILSHRTNKHSTFWSCQQIWIAKAPYIEWPVSLGQYLVTHNCWWTRETFKRRGIFLCNRFRIYAGGARTINHLFIHCKVTAPLANISPKNGLCQVTTQNCYIVGTMAEKEQENKDEEGTSLVSGFNYSAIIYHLPVQQGGKCAGKETMDALKKGKHIKLNCIISSLFFFFFLKLNL